MTFDGRKGKEQDINVHLAGAALSLFPKKGGNPLITLPYKSILRVTYTHTREPIWDPKLPGLPENPDYKRSNRHWLFIQRQTDFVLVYLNDSNVTDVLQAFEARAGVKILRP